jgi:RNA polymerase sigma-70 factor (ECF subfamily)
MQDDDWIGEALAERERPLTLYAAQLLGDRELARDVVQETFLRLCSQPRHLVEDRLAAWLYAVCRRLCLDVRRKERRMSPDVQPARRPDPGPGPSEVAEDRDRAAGLSAAVEGLPDRQRELVRLKFQHGLSYREIAGVMELTVSNVGVQIHEAMKTLRSAMRVVGAKEVRP